MLKVFLCLLCLLTPWLTHAKLYKLVDENGSITFTDTPPFLDTKEHHLRSINAVSNPLFNMDKLSLVIPYIEENGGMIVTGSVNNIAMRFIVDTGATLVSIPPSVAKKAGLIQDSNETITAQTANGAVQVQKMTIPTLTIDKVKQTQVDATIQTVSEIDADLGLLGMSFLGRYKMTIDDKRKEIQLGTK